MSNTVCTFFANLGFDVSYQNYLFPFQNVIVGVGKVVKPATVRTVAAVDASKWLMPNQKMKSFLQRHIDFSNF